MSWERAEWHLSLLFSHVAVPGLCEGQQLFLLHYGAAAASTAFAMTILQQATVELDVATMGIYRVVFAALSVCPVMSLLGAKRPQYGVWQFIVGSLAAVLALPAVSAVLIHPGALPNLHILGRCFLPVLVIVGWMNFVGTRRAVAATLIAAGHLGLIWPLLPGVEFEAALPQTTRDLMSISSITAGALLRLFRLFKQLSNGAQCLFAVFRCCQTTKILCPARILVFLRSVKRLVRPGRFG